VAPPAAGSASRATTSPHPQEVTCLPRRREHAEREYPWLAEPAGRGRASAPDVTAGFARRWLHIPLTSAAHPADSMRPEAGRMIVGSALRPPPPPVRAERTVLDVVVPVFNEETDLEPSVRRLHEHLSGQFPYPFRITIADNASTDATPRIAARLAAELPDVVALRLAEKGRGRAL